MASSESVYMIATPIITKFLGKEQKAWIFYPIMYFSFLNGYMNSSFKRIFFSFFFFPSNEQ